jgi:hypothetical protein
VDKAGWQRRKPERGVTIALVAITLLALIAMAALAIDVVSLYVAHAEAQKAANAAALAGAKAFVSSGFTSGLLGAAPSQGSSQDLVCQSGGGSGGPMANQLAIAAAAGNQIANQSAAIQSITCNFPANGGNPQIKVTVQRAGLPIFFARIWSPAASTVSATATAEAYNPSGQTTPIQVFVKPWLLPNCDPHLVGSAATTCTSTQQFVSAVDGTINPNSVAFFGQQTITLNQARGTGPQINGTDTTAAGSKGIDYYPLYVPIDAPPPLCPACDPAPADEYLDSIACSSQFPVSCGQNIVTAGPQPAQISVDRPRNGLRVTATTNTRCLIHSNGSGLNQGQDVFAAAPSPSTPPVTIQGGTSNPNPNLQNATNISRSDAIVTVPLYNGPGAPGSNLNLCPAGNCSVATTVVGFLQLAITQTNSPGGNGQDGSFDAYILNAAGCSPAPSGTAVTGGGVAPVPVRLISQ